MPEHGIGAMAALFALSNFSIAAGYAMMPYLVLRHIRLTWRAMLFGIGFFVGCAGTHLGMALLVHHAGWFWTIWHIIQAVCTWFFILTFSCDLKRARARLRAKPEVIEILSDHKPVDEHGPDAR